MGFTFLLKGLIIGISVAAPVGPIGVLTIKRSLNQGLWAGFFTGMGAAFADAVYGMVAGFGLSSVSNFLISYEFWLKLIGGIFLLILGIKGLLSKPAEKEASIKSNSLLSNFVSTFFLTVTNPATIFSFLAIFTAMGLGTERESNYWFSSILVFGVFIGSAVWWLFLSFAVSSLKHKLSMSGLLWINRGSGIPILSFGIWSLWGCF